MDIEVELEKIRERNQDVNELVRSIKRGEGRGLSPKYLRKFSRDALAMAIEQCSPDDVAKFVLEII